MFSERRDCWRQRHVQGEDHRAGQRAQVPHCGGQEDRQPDEGTTFEIQCKVNGPNVDGNRRWYLFERKGNPAYGWVAARYVKNAGKAPQECRLGFPDSKVVAKPSVITRTAPSTKAKSSGTLKYGVEFHTICKVNGTKVGGNPRWYQLFDGRWVTARYAKNINGLVPEFCKKSSFPKSKVPR